MERIFRYHAGHICVIDVRGCMGSPFIHLHLHTEYSLIDGLIRIKPLVTKVAELGMPAVAVTDFTNFFGIVKFYKAALAAGVKPIIGAEICLHPEQADALPDNLVLLCKNAAGYRNLTEIISLAYQKGQNRGRPMVTLEWIKAHNEGLILLSGANQGDVGKALINGDLKLAAKRAKNWQKIFGDRFYLEVQRTGRENDELLVQASVKLAVELDLPVVATNDTRFLTQDEFEAHEARVCIHDGRVLDDPRRPRIYSEQQYVRSSEEMQELFADLPEAIENSYEIARRCNVQLHLGENFLPEFPIPGGLSTDDYLRKVSAEGLDARLQKIFPDLQEREQKRPEYEERLKLELDVIISMGFPGYFLIVADFIQWAKENDVPVGPGRGSGAGSLVAYVLQITDLDPLAYDLLFERFLNPERVSMPDFDVDFCMDGRDRVIEYVAQRYGREKVSQIITYGTMAAKAVVRDVGRVMGHPYGFVDRIAKLIPFEIGMTLDKALEQEEELRSLYESDEEVATLIDMAKNLEGCARNAGKHAGGVVIAPSALTDFTPVYCEQGSTSIVSQYDKDDVEAVGLVKFDFLGLRTLTIINTALKIINAEREKNQEPVIDISTIPMDDKASFDLLKACQTTAVFQLESRGMKDLIKRLQPDCFEDIVALVALFRPGPLQSGMVDDFIARKHGAAIEYPHPELEPILKPTYGIILYQEQVMQIAQVLAGYTLGGADLLRRAMGKKKPEEMAKQREIFMKGAVERGVEEKTATYIFDLMEKFAGYGFNKSHSAAYALVAYQTAWLKAHYPAAFMAAVLSADMDNTDKVVTLIDECRSMELQVLAPDVNVSDYVFTVRNQNRILYGLGAIKGVGQAAIESMIEERNTNAPFESLYDFCQRVDLRKINRRVLEALIKAGGMDGFGETRASLFAQLSNALKVAEQHGRDSAAGQEDLFGGSAEQVMTFEDDIQLPEWEEDQRLQFEKDTLGLYLTGHPISQYETELRSMTSGRVAQFMDGAEVRARTKGNEQRVILAGLVVDLRVRINQRGNRFAFVTIDDRTGRVEIGVFGDTYERYKTFLVKDRLVIVNGLLNVDDETDRVRLRAEEVYDLDQARDNFAKRLVLTIKADKIRQDSWMNLVEILRPHREGSCPVQVYYDNGDARAAMRFADEWRITPNRILLKQLKSIFGDDCRLEY